MTPGIDASQRTAARVVGFAYLFAMIPANFAEFYVSGRLIVSNKPAYFVPIFVFEVAMGLWLSFRGI